MNNEKKYLAKTAALISDKSVDNQLGVMFANVKACILRYRKRLRYDENRFRQR